jgi:hypothetical protein
MNHDGRQPRYRIRRLPQWVLEPGNLIRRPHIAELIMASGHMPASTGRTYDCTAPTGSCLHKPLACRAVPHMSQTQLVVPIHMPRRTVLPMIIRLRLLAGLAVVMKNPLEQLSLLRQSRAFGFDRVLAQGPIVTRNTLPQNHLT